MSCKIIPKLSLALASFLLLSNSCSQNSDKDKTQISISYAAIPGSESMNRRVLVTGQTSGQSFSISLNGTGESKNILLKNGPWEMRAIEWQGANNLEGPTRCDSTNLHFDGGSQPVVFNLKAEHCGSPDFSPLEYLNGSSFMPLKIFSCEDPDGLPSDYSLGCSTTSNTNISSYQSVRVHMNAFSGPNKSGANETIKSQCHSLSSSSKSTTTNLRVPIGPGYPTPNPEVFPTGVFLFQNADCSGAASEIVKFPSLIHQGYSDQGGSGFIRPGNTSNNTNFLFLFKSFADNIHIPEVLTFGDGFDNNQSITTHISNTNTYSLPTPDLDGDIRRFSAIRRVANISGNNITTVAAFSSPLDFKIGDEVMWHVTAEGTDGSGDDGCGPALSAGMYGNTRVTSVNTGSKTLTLNTPIPKSSVTNAGLSTGYSDHGIDFCLIQITRVPNFLNLTLNHTITVSAPPLTNSTPGGLLAIRVAGLLSNATGSGSHSFITEGKGFRGGVGSATIGNVDAGNSFRGKGTSTSANNASGGGRATSAPDGGAGGGGAYGSGGDGYTGGGGGGSGANSGTSCILTNSCLAIGGGGGGGHAASAADGGHGGGVLFVTAHDISDWLQLKANASASGSASPKGAGGGGGGQVILKTIDSSALTGITIEAKGGNASAGGDAGSGGGGYVKVDYCSNHTPGATISPTVTPGAPGGGGSPGNPGTVGLVNVTPLSNGQAFCD